MRNAALSVVGLEQMQFFFSLFVHSLTFAAKAEAKKREG
jgi:hypothetical protein